MDLKELAARYVEKRADYDRAHKASQEAHRIWRQAETDFIDEMLDQHIKTWRHSESGALFSLSERFHVSVTQDNNESIRRWLLENAGDDAPYLTEVCSKKAVTDYVRDLVNKNREEDREDEDGIPAFLGLKTAPVLSYRDRND